MKINIGTIVLADGVEKNEAPYNVKISNTRAIQVTQSIRGESVKSYDRGNQQTTLEFTVTRKHESIEDAQMFILQHSSSLNNLSDYLTIIEEPSNLVYYLTDATIAEINGYVTNNTSTHQYKVIGGKIVEGN